MAHINRPNYAVSTTGHLRAYRICAAILAALCWCCVPDISRAAWDIMVIDESGDVGRHSSLALDGSNFPHISYYDDTNGHLKYAYYNGSNWTVQTIDADGVVGMYSSIALDSAGRPHISYFDETYGQLKCYGYFDGSMRVRVLDSGGGNVVGLYTAIELNGNNQLRISYFDQTNGSLKYYYTTIDGEVIETPDTGGTGLFTAIALDKTSTPNRTHISYYDQQNGDLWYYGWNYNKNQMMARLVDMGQSNVSGSEDVGLYTSIGLNSNNLPRISYYDATNGQLKIFFIGKSAPYWFWEVVDDTAQVGQYSSLDIDKRLTPNIAHISYYDATNGNLKHAWPSSSGAAPWYSETVDASADVGLYTSLAVDSTGKVHISYYDRTNERLKFATTASNIVTTSTIATTSTTTLPPTTTTTSAAITSTTTSSAGGSSTTTTAGAGSTTTTAGSGTTTTSSQTTTSTASDSSTTSTEPADNATSTTTSTQPAEDTGSDPDATTTSSTSSTTSLPAETTTTSSVSSPAPTTVDTTTVPQEAPAPLAISSLPAETAVVARTYFYDIETTHDSAPLTYRMITWPEGMEIDGTIGIITWKPTVKQLGVHKVAVLVETESGESARQEFSVTVRLLNKCPADEMLQDDPGQLRLLHALRDRRLAGSPLGMTLICLYYAHADELAGLLAKDNEMRDKARRLVRGLSPAIEGWVREGGKPACTPLDIKRLADLLAELQPQASPALARTIDFIRSRIFSGDITTLLQTRN